MAEEYEIEINIKTEPRPIRVGEDKYYLIPEMMGPEYVEKFNKFDAERIKIADQFGEKHEKLVSKDLYQDKKEYEKAVAEKAARDPEYLKANRNLMKSMVSQFLIDDNVDKFLDKTYPDRVYTELINKIIRIYTGRPTTSATESGGQ